jgi:phospholipid transport system transporter-binding protein
MSQLILGASLTLREVMDLQRELIVADAGSEELRVEGSGVQRVDTAGLQLLVALAKRREAAGQPLRWSGVSPALLQGSTRLGIAALLDLPGAGPGDVT